MTQAWSWGLAAVSVLGLWTTGNKKRYGWLISFGSEGLWLTYALVTGQYGFVAMSVVFAAVHIRNWLKWRESDDSRQARRRGRAGFMG